MLSRALAQTSPTVSVTPAALNFAYVIGNALPTAQTASVRISPASLAPYTATNVQPWLVVSPPSGLLPAALSVQVNPTSLPVGVYTDTITLNVTGVATPSTVAVTLTVTAPSSGITPTPLTLGFTAPPTSSTGTITLTTTGEPVSFTVTAGAKWMTVTPAAGVVLPGEEFPLTVTVNSTGLAPQATPYTGKVTIVPSTSGPGSAGAGSQNVTVSYTVNTVAPTIASFFPATLPVRSTPVTLTVRGTGFYSATLAGLTGLTAPLVTKVLNANALLATIPASELAAPGTLALFVQNPPPGGSSSTVSVPVANTPALDSAVDAASYTPIDTVSPGELVTLFGANIGPITPAGMTTTTPGFVDTTLGGVSVTVEGIAAPLLYVSQNQVSIQVPFGVAPGAGKQIALINGTSSAPNLAVTVAATNPAIFTSNGSGAGQAAALDYNSVTTAYSLNSVTSPAYIGSTVVLYLTGAGNYDTGGSSTSLITGELLPLTSTPPVFAAPPIVTIGGVNATVTYAGAVPGSLLGLVQLNVQVPTGATTGNASPISVAIGGATTQTGVTLALHP